MSSLSICLVITYPSLQLEAQLPLVKLALNHIPATQAGLVLLQTFSKTLTSVWLVAYMSLSSLSNCNTSSYWKSPLGQMAYRHCLAVEGPSFRANLDS